LKLFALAGRIRNYSGRAGWAVGEQGIAPLVQLVLTPIFLRRLGGESFGIWMFALTIVSMSPLVSLGASVAATKHVSADLGRGLRDQAIAAIRAAIAVAMTGGVLVSVLLALLAPLLAAHLLHNLGAPGRVGLVLALCGVAAAVQEIDNVFAGALRGAERFDLCAMVEVPARVLIGCVLVWLCESSVGVHGLLVTLIFLLAIKATVKGWQVARLFGGVSTCLPSMAAEPLRRVVSFGAWQWLQTAGTVFFSAADQLLIGGLIGAAALARYSTCLQIAQYVHTLPSVMTQVIFPRLSALGPNIGAVRGNEILRSATIATVGAAILLGLPLMLFARPILRIWIGVRFADENYWLLIVLVVVHIVLAFNIASYFVLLGSGRAPRSATIVLAAGATQFAAAVAAAPLGIFAVACSRFVYAFATAFLYKAARYRHDG
jgi:O-antigen/teichoic acid export membrane protein